MRWRSFGGALLLTLGVAVAVHAPAPAAQAGTTSVPRPDHVVVVVEENHSSQSIIGSPDAPYLNSLARTGAMFSNAFAETHPSQPNYLALYSGSTQGVTDDSCPLSLTAPNLGSQLIGAGLRFSGFSEGLPSVGASDCFAGRYARKHNPWVDFPDVPAAANRPFTDFPTDFTTLPEVSFVIPDLGHDMHDGTVAQGDAWAQANLGSYETWARTHNSLLVVTFDEDDFSASNHIATIITGERVVPGDYAETVNHYSLLRTVEDGFGLPPIGAAATAAPILDVWSPPGGNQAPVAAFSVSCTDLTCDVDGAASSDPDGTVMSWTWDFGDGATATGATARHTYAGPGAQAITLTVADDRGATTALVRRISVTAPAGAPSVSDTFNRTVVGGLGRADIGGAWTALGSASSFSVAPGGAALTLAKPAAQLEGFVGPTATDTDLTVQLQADKVPAGGSLYLSAVPRRVGAGNVYAARVLVQPTGAVTLRIARVVGGVESTIAGPVAVPGPAFAAASPMLVRVQASGTGPTVLRARAWRSADAEPGAWQVSASDTTPALQVPGTVAVVGYVSGAATNTPLTVGITSVVAVSGGGAPANRAPTASFTSSCVDLGCDVDGRASADSDGTILDYAWQFGDGSTATGPTARHVNSTGGSRSVTLTVTDNGGLTGSVSAPVTVTAPATSVLVSDAFGRTVRNGFGTADTGGPWTTRGTASLFTVDPGVATMALSTPATQLDASVGPAGTASDVTATFTLDRIPTGGPVHVVVIGRYAGRGNFYGGRVLMNPGGTMTLQLSRTVNGVDTVLGAPVRLGGTVTAGSPVTVRVQVFGTAPAVVRARAWLAASPEPAAWQVSTDDSTAALQTPGTTGVVAYLGKTATNAPVRVRLTRFGAVPANTAP